MATKTKKSFTFHRNTTFLSLLVGYTAYYLCRQNFSVAYGPMKESLGMDPILFGSISSFGTLVYAFGKFFMGPLADARSGRSVFLFGLFVSAAFSVFFGLSSGVGLFFIFWSLNRLAQSMGWPGLVNVMSQWFESKSYGTAMGLMSVSYQFGGVVASLFAGMLLSMGVGWRGIFIVPAVALCVIGLIIGIFITDKPEDLKFAPVKTAAKKDLAASEGKLSYFSRFKILFSNKLFVAMCFLSFSLTLLRECFNLWMPAYFLDLGAKASTAAFKSAIFPLLGCLGTLFVGWYTDRYMAAHRGRVMGIFLVLLTGVLVVLAFTKTSGVALLLVGVAGFLLLAPYSLIGGAIALDFGGKKAAGTAAGIFDGIGYLGATLAGVGVAKVVVMGGWTQAFIAMALMTFVSAILCFLLKDV